MQLFILDRNPRITAAMLCDIHLRKMCLENAQILSALIIRGVSPLPPFCPRPHNINHPVINALDSCSKINWCIILNYALHREYFFRFSKKHALSFLSPFYGRLLFSRKCGWDKDWSFARNFKNFHTGSTDIITAYREYYRFKKSIITQWHYSRRHEPEWLK